MKRGEAIDAIIAMAVDMVVISKLDDRHLTEFYIFVQSEFLATELIRRFNGSELVDHFYQRSFSNLSYLNYGNRSMCVIGFDRVDRVD